MLEVDLHAHSFFSLCGIHTHIELLTRAKELGMKGLAITDHGPALDSRIPWPFYDRLQDPVPGIRFIKGMECNILDDKGTIDLSNLPSRFIPFMQIILVGLHPNIKTGSDPRTYTDMVIRALEKNRCIDVITHPNELEFPLEFDRLAEAARSFGVALELNNSKTLYQRTTDCCTRELVRACKRAGCGIIISSDTHAIHELGLDDSVRPYLKEEGVDEELFINSTAEKAFAFIDGRLGNKR